MATVLRGAANQEVASWCSKPRASRCRLQSSESPVEAALRATEANETVGPLMKSNELTKSSTSTAEMELSKRVPSFERDAVSAAAFAQPLGMLCSSAIARSDQMNHSHIMYHLGRVPPTAKNGQTSLLLT